MNGRTTAGAMFLVLVLPACPPQAAAQGDEPVLAGKPVSEIVLQLQNQNRGLQARAARTLGEAPAEMRARIVPQLLPLLKSERENDRAWAAQVLGEYGPQARSAVNELLPVLEGTQYERNRAAAAKALGQILKDAEPSAEVEKATQALMVCFDDKYSDVRREAVTACGMIGPAAKACVPLLPKRYVDTEWLKDAECYLVRRAAAWTTGRMGSFGAVHVDSIIGLMHANVPVATEFVDALGALGPVHGNVVPNIMDKMEQTVYGGFQGANAEQLANYVSHCLSALEAFGAKSAGAVDLLVRLLAADLVARDPGLTIRVLNTLAAIGPAAGRAVPAIEGRCLKSGDSGVAKAAEAALARMKGP